MEKPKTNKMVINQKGLELIKSHEGLMLKPYLCPAGVPTIGYGATYYPYGERVTMDDKAITEEYAETLLKTMLSRYEEGVDRYVLKGISSNQFSALVSFAYNVGLGALKSSTLLRRVNVNPNNPNIEYQFLRWNKAGGKVLNGLSRRRKEESKLYFS